MSVVAHGPLVCIQILIPSNFVVTKTPYFKQEYATPMSPSGVTNNSDSSNIFCDMDGSVCHYLLTDPHMKNHCRLYLFLGLTRSFDRKLILLSLDEF